MLKCDSATIEQNKKAIETCIKHGLRVVGSVIFSSPTETPQDMEDTIKFIDYARKAGADRIWSNVMTPLPGTEIWEIAKEKNKVNTEMNFELLDFQASDNPLLLDESINKKYFKRIYLKGRRHLYYFKWRKLFSMLKNKPFYTILLALFYPWEYIKKALIPWEE